MRFKSIKIFELFHYVCGQILKSLKVCRSKKRVENHCFRSMVMKLLAGPSILSNYCSEVVVQKFFSFLLAIFSGKSVRYGGFGIHD